MFSTEFFTLREKFENALEISENKYGHLDGRPQEFVSNLV